MGIPGVEAPRRISGVEPMQGQIVPGEGPIGAKWCIIGERPGWHESRELRPFVGESGQLQDRHLRRNGMNRRDGYLDNVCPDYHHDNPTPTPEEVEEWGPRLMDRLRRVRPKFIVAAGQVAIRFFLGPDVYVESTHGIAYNWERDGLKAVVIPIYHPAAPLHQPDLMAHSAWDYKRVAEYIKGKLPVSPPYDEFPRPEYWVANGDHSHHKWDGEVAIDSEGTPGDVFSFQVTKKPGEAVVYLGGVPKLARGSLLIFHSGMYEIEMAASVGVDLIDPHLGYQFFDTMVAAYLLRLEPQSLKMLSRRWCGMDMKDYSEVVGQAGLEKQLEYLQGVAEGGWEKPEGRVEWGNDGTSRLYKPQPIQQRAIAILTDYYSGKLDKDGERCDPLKRWRKCDRELRQMVERDFGKMPIGTLRDVPIKEAVEYGGRDPDATLRLYPRLKAALAAEGLTDLMAMKMKMLPVAAMMRMNGILGRKESFEKLSEAMFDKMLVISGKISKQYFSGNPFNPASSQQTAHLMRKRGLRGAKKTKSGKMSTSKKSIEHLRYKDDSIELLEQWREHQKVRDSFAESVLDNWPDDDSVVQCRIRGDLKITRVESGRFSMALLPGEPSAPLMAIPVRSDLGKQVRDCYIAEEGYELFEADLDQAEMRIMADESGDQRMVDLFNDGKIDIHGDTASRIFKVSYDDCMAKLGKMKYRYPAKRTGFGVITGIQGPGLYDQLRMAGCQGWNVNSAARMIEDWLDLFPGVRTYMSDCAQEAREAGGVIKDRWGMPRYLPNIFSEDKYQRLEAQRQSHSHRIQGGAQGWLQNVMGWLWEQLAPYGGAVRFILQIHDSLMWEIMKGMREVIEPIILDGMCNHGGARLKVPMKSSGAWADSWGQLKD